MYGYLFEVMFDVHGPSVKYGADVSDLVSEEYTKAIQDARTAKNAAAKIGAYTPGMMRRAINPIIEQDNLGDKLNAIYPMFLRAQITGGSLYLVKSDDPITADDIDAMMRRMFISGELEKFLEEAKIR